MEEIWEAYGLQELEEGLKGLFPEYGISLEKLLGKLVSGDLAGAFSYLWEALIQGLGSQVLGIRELLIRLLLLGIFSAFVGYFVEIFDKKQVARLSFYCMYLLLTAVLLKSFEQAALITSEVIGQIVTFVRLLLPVYLVAVGVTSGAVTVSGAHQVWILFLYGAERILEAGLIPAIGCYCMLTVVNGVWAEQRLSMLMKLLEKGIRAIHKTFMGVITGVSIFQSVIAPAADAVQGRAIRKLVSMIPGIGNAAEGVSELVIGSAVLIKNALGVGAMLLLVVLCAVPFLRIGMIGCVLKLAAALMGIVSDKRLVTCTDRVGEGCMMLLRTAGTALLLFLMILVILTVATNAGG